MVKLILWPALQPHQRQSIPGKFKGIEGSSSSWGKRENLDVGHNCVPPFGILHGDTLLPVL